MNIALIGYGKMGKAIEDIALKRGHTITCKISSSNLQEFNPRVLQWADVAIEFSTPESAFNNISQCIIAGLPVISGTTGWLNRKEEIDQLCQNHNGAFLYASNFSIGVNIFFEINKILAHIMDKYEVYDVSILESHHAAKLDKPSGTAITLAKDIIESIDRKKVWTITEPASSNSRDIFIESLRTGEVPGTHIVKYRSDIDDIEIKHEAHSRMGFAKGAIIAAEWLKDKKGVFSMKDVLEL
ncbi:MAG TPA: 4-hydroxy-tetrahydrodipicolinate reductase [Saprospiraceae bacterium]|nr:4-hydroxy-tetrahydrodipicolinate reductase [Saprospiraceae bacterium]HRO08002.1 4-hydroxy-tetrahydrodipicolinate reductase [Saprospiraceae bacterium]HRO72945.1 4-hydroxy-tetrahydrodipicolinate reductase [Saprospiraceae bacterium]HRP41497.1 4-hydroxy-tetrahydrodipicolinate reductase [Saprospiraceae bacterium]